MNRHRALRSLAIVLIAMLSAPVAGASDKLSRKLERSAAVYESLFDTQDHMVPESVLERAECIAIIPSVIKGALVWGGRHGRGVISCQNDRGDWSPPAFVQLSGGSLGFQIGGESSDQVLFFMSRRSIESMLESKFILGGNASVAAGPAGRSAEASTDGKLNAEIYAFAKSRGLFAGVSVEGARLAPDLKAIRNYYGKRIWPEDILFEHRVPKLPREARELVKLLP